MKIITLPLGMYRTNTYVLVENGHAIVIDPAENAEYIAECAEKAGGEIERVYITHGHFDHIGGTAGLQTLGAKVYITKVDFNHIEEYNESFGTYTKPFELDYELTDGLTIEWCGHEISVLSTPGHTPGSVCFIIDDKYLFTGDTLFRLGMGNPEFLFGDSAELLKSLQKLMAISKNYVVMPGHGNQTTLDFERENNPYVQ